MIRFCIYVSGTILTATPKITNPPFWLEDLR